MPKPTLKVIVIPAICNIHIYGGYPHFITVRDGAEYFSVDGFGRPEKLKKLKGLITNVLLPYIIGILVLGLK